MDEQAVAQVEGWPGPPVDLVGLLDEIEGFVRRYVLLDPNELVVVALWVAHTHAFEAAEATPYLQITSATKLSGKTRLLEVLELIVNRPWFTGRTTAAALQRKINEEKPTLLLDESDAAFGGDKEYAEWYPQIRDALIARQRKDGSWGAGHETPMAIITLSTPHRYIPIYQR